MPWLWQRQLDLKKECFFHQGNHDSRGENDMYFQRHGHIYNVDSMYFGSYF